MHSVMDNLNQSAELLCTMSPRIKHKLKPGQKQFRRVAGASILALKKNIRRSSFNDKSIQTIDNNDLNVESTSSTESCDSEKWKLNILSESPIVISDSESDFESESMDKCEQDAINLQNCSLPNDKVNDIECWIEKVNAANENKDTTAYTEFSTICGSETGDNFLPKERGPVVNSTFISKDCKRFDEFFRHQNKDPKVVNNSLESDENEVIISSKNLVIEDSFQSLNESLTTRVEKKLLSKNDSLVHDEKNTLETLPNAPVGEGVDLELMLDKLYGRSWREKQELILPKTEPRKNKHKPVGTNMYSERKPKKAETLKSNNLLQKLQNERLKINEKPSLYTKLKVLCDSDTNSENSPIQVYPKTRLKFDDSSDELTNDPKTSKYFKTKRGLKNDTQKCDSSEENYEISDLEQSSEERIGKEMNSLKDPPNKNKLKGKNTVTTKKKTSNKENIPKKNIQNKIHAQPNSIKINRRPQSSSTSNSDDETSKTKFVTKRRVEKPISKSSVSISSDDEWNQEISKIHRQSELYNGTYSFLASLSGNIPISKCDMSARIYRNNFKTFKDQLLSKLFKMYNEQVFDNALAPDMLFEWNDRMTGTAGYCYCKKITRKSGLVERSSRVVLSTKVIDCAQRMRDTLIHELCHAATWIVNCVSDGHGPYWKTWAHKAMVCFPELPPIKRCHDYVINTKYTYKCSGCGYSIGRHTKSLDVERKRCGYCHGKFEVLINKTTKKGETKSVPATPKKEATGFALFVKENYGVHKTPNLKHGEVMKLLGQKFQKIKVNQT